MAKKILIIEDLPALANALHDKFNHEGFETIHASNGLEGLEMIESEKPDLILLDIIMPKMDGLTMIKELRQKDPNNAIPIIILTNLTDSDAVFNSIKSRITDYLVKADWSLEDVVKKVKEKLGI